jgi:hypothetical protein
MFSSNYEAMEFHEERSRDLIHEANQNRLAKEIRSYSIKSGSGYLRLTVVLGTMLISWGEKLKNMS